MPAFSFPHFETLFSVLDHLPDAVVFVKDAEARYVYANETLLRRLGLTALHELTGRPASAVFPTALGERYTQQDLKVLAGQPLTNHLELHVYPGGHVGWCLTTKRILHSGGRVVGLVGLSRDLTVPQHQLAQLGQAVTYLQEHCAENLHIPALARMAGLSVSAFERQIKRLYGVNPSQLLIRARIDAAMPLLEKTDWSVARIAVECGYFDHSAFTRVFRSVVGITPRAYRDLKK